MKNLVKAKLKRGQASVGTWITIGHPDVAMYLANIGFDWLVCDMEHGPYGPETYHFMVQAMLYNRGNCMPMARIPWNDLIWVKKVMDAGATGIVVPRVESAEEAKKLVRLMKYPPDGERGAGPRLAAFEDPNYFDTVNAESLCVVMIESAKGVKNVDEIFSVDGVDACFIGPADLSIDMGIRGQYSNPKFTDALDRVLEAGKAKGVAPGMHCWLTPGPTNINEALRRGFKFCALSTDVLYLTDGAKSAIDSVQGWKH